VAGAGQGAGHGGGSRRTCRAAGSLSPGLARAARRAVVVVPMLEPRVSGYALSRLITPTPEGQERSRSRSRSKSRWRRREREREGERGREREREREKQIDMPHFHKMFKKLMNRANNAVH